MDGQRRRQKIQQGKEAKVTTANQNGDPFHAAWQSAISSPKRTLLSGFFRPDRTNGAYLEGGEH